MLGFRLIFWGWLLGAAPLAQGQTPPPWFHQVALQALPTAPANDSRQLGLGASYALGWQWRPAWQPGLRLGWEVLGRSGELWQVTPLSAFLRWRTPGAKSLRVRAWLEGGYGWALGPTRATMVDLRSQGGWRWQPALGLEVALRPRLAWFLDGGYLRQRVSQRLEQNETSLVQKITFQRWTLRSGIEF